MLYKLNQAFTTSFCFSTALLSLLHSDLIKFQTRTVMIFNVFTAVFETFVPLGFYSK